MTPERDQVAATLSAWLDEGSSGAPDYVLEAVLHQLPATPQLRGRRSTAISSIVAPALWATAAAVVLVALLAAGGPWLHSFRVGMAASPPADPTPISDVDLAIPGQLAAGRYAVPEPLPSGLSFEVPSGWAACPLSEYEQGVCAPLGQADIGVTFMIVEDVVADPCTGERRALPVGPALDDLASAIAGMPGFEASAIEVGTADGHDARTLTVTARARCPNLRTWITPSRTNGVAVGEANLVRMIDVNGVRVVIAGAYHPTAVGALDAVAQRALIEGVVESIRIAD